MTRNFIYGDFAYRYADISPATASKAAFLLFAISLQECADIQVELNFESFGCVFRVADFGNTHNQPGLFNAFASPKKVIKSARMKKQKSLCPCVLLFLFIRLIFFVLLKLSEVRVDVGKAFSISPPNACVNVLRHRHQSLSSGVYKAKDSIAERLYCLFVHLIRFSYFAVKDILLL